MRMTFIFVLICAGVALGDATACTPRDDAATAIKRAQNAVDLVEYRKQLRGCKEEGKDAGSYAVYEQCAREVDIKFGFEKAFDGGPHE